MSVRSAHVADQLRASQDLQGNRAEYRHGLQQTIYSQQGKPVQTQWHAKMHAWHA